MFRGASRAARVVAVIGALTLVAAACGADDDAADIPAVDDAAIDAVSDEDGSDAEPADDPDDEPTTTETTDSAAQNDDPATGDSTGGRLVIGLPAEVAGLDPAVTGFQVPVNRLVGLAVYDPVTIGRGGEVVPYLAESLEPSDDLTVWTLTLPDGVRFHDGEPLDAPAVVANLDRFTDPDAEAPFPGAAELAILESYEAIDDLTVEMRLAAPSAAFPAVLSSNAGMFSSPAAIAADPGSLNTAPVGTGPYKVQTFSVGGDIVLVPNDDYWMADGGPYLDEIVLRVIPEDASRFASLQSGDLDLILTGDARAIRTAIDDPQYEATVASFIGSQAIIPNLRDGSPLADAEIRRAMALAIDRQALADVVDQGVVPASTGPFDPDSPFYDDFGYPELDPNAARQIIDAVGPVDFTLTIVGSDSAVQRAELIQQMLGDVGITMSIESADQETVIQDALQGNFEAVLLSTPDSPDPDFGFTRRWQSGSPVNFGDYRSDEADRLLAEARSTIDRDERIALYQEFGRTLNEDLAYLWLMHNYTGIISRPDVTGIADLDPQVLGAFRVGPIRLSD